MHQLRVVVVLLDDVRYFDSIRHVEDEGFADDLVVPCLAGHVLHRSQRKVTLYCACVLQQRKQLRNDFVFVHDLALL